MNNLTQTRLDPDDPRLTAYALGELEGAEAAQVAAANAPGTPATENKANPNRNALRDKIIFINRRR